MLHINDPMSNQPKTDTAAETSSGIKRITKACGSCRQSKVRCDGNNPCARCKGLGKACSYQDRPKEPTEDRLERLEQEIPMLKEQISVLQNREVSSNYVSERGNGHGLTSIVAVPPPPTHRLFPSTHTSPTAASTAAITSPLSSTSEQHQRKRKRSHLQVRKDPVPDFVSKGLIAEDIARSCFDTFFQGCDRFVPIFDPAYDTFESIRARSVILFNAIINVGCSIRGNAEPQLPHVLNFELKKLLNLVVLGHESQTLETVQALLLIACYSTERSLLLSFATKVALDLDLPDAFERLTRHMLPLGMNEQDQCTAPEDSADLTRRARTWFGLLVLENILHVDAGKLPIFAAKGGARRSRVLLQQATSTALDLRLLSQVELNYLRTRIHDTFETFPDTTDEDILDQVRDAKLDLDLWYTDWRSAIESSSAAGHERPSLLVNLTIQWHWSEAMAYFRALKCLGTENVEAMSSTGRSLLQLAKMALKKHLAVTIDESNQYLANLRYAMDFVWAKCAFCFLLLLKLSRLVPDSIDDSYRLLEDGNKLLRSLTNASTSAGSNTSRLYLQVLSTSIDKYARALRDNGDNANSGQAMFFWEASNANNELQSFVPEQFVFEWDFPGLTLFSSPTAWQDFFDDFLFGDGGTEN